MVSETTIKTRKAVVASALNGGAFGGGAVLVTSYGMVSSNPANFGQGVRGQKWDYIILDEGHKIKNVHTK